MSLKPALIQRISSPSDTLSMHLTSPGCSGVIWVLLLASAASVLFLKMCLMCCRSRDCASRDVCHAATIWVQGTQLHQLGRHCYSIPSSRGLAGRSLP